MSKFSIIVPVYNVEKYLSQCLNSIIMQTINNYEIILINDGSTDNSGEICNKIALAHHNIVCIHKKNGGASDARNAGIKRAKGEYLIFVDSDDYIEKESLEKFEENLQKSNTPDLMITRIKKIYPDLSKKYMDKNMLFKSIRAISKEEIINWMFNHSDSLWPAQRYVVKRSYIKKYDLKFAVGYFHEDLDWTSRLFLYAETFSLLGFYWYNHRMQRKGSITTEKNPKRTLDVIRLATKNIRDNEYGNIKDELKQIIYKRILKSLFSSLSDYKYYYNQKEKQLIIDALYQNKDVFKYTTEMRHKLFVYFSKMFGFRVGMAIMSAIHKL